MKIIDAIYKRRSVRNFMDNEIEDDIIKRIEVKFREIEVVFDNEDVKFIMSDYCKKSFYAPYYIGIYASNTKEGQINAGFAIQQLSIYLSAIGIANCYQAKSPLFKPMNFAGKKLIVSMAMGYPQESMYRESDEINRFKTEKICVFKEKPNEEVTKIIELARIAPSSYNAQPWRFVVYNNRIHVFAKNRLINNIEKFKYVNIGIMLGNISLGTEELWIDINMKVVKNINDKEYGDNEYIISIYNKNTDGRRI